MKIKLVLIISVFTGLCTSLGAAPKAENTLLYLDPKQPVSKRVESLMSLMTLDEKIAQMCQYVGLEHMRDAEKNATEEELKSGHARGYYKGLNSYDVERMTSQAEIGSFLHVVKAEEANHLQRLAEQSRLKIPLLIGIDAIHGNGLVAGSTIYPSPIGMASTFAPELVEKASRQTALEMRAAGSHWAFTPNIEIARDARWGRVGECFGEDPLLVSRMGVASVRGLQGENTSGSDAVLACVKHLVAGGVPNNGTNAAPVELSEAELRNIFLPPFEAAIREARPFTLMPAHNELNGMPCHANKWLIEDIMRREYGFDGIVVSDWMDMEAIATKHNIAESVKEAFFLSVDAGVDVHMHGPQFAEYIKELVGEGRIPVARIDSACAKILEAKFRLGLFENRYTDAKTTAKVLFNDTHKQTALDIARRSVVLLKNNKILPIDRTKYKKIVVTGPNADNQSTMGDWVFEQPRANVSTIVDGIRQFAAGSQVDFVDVGWNLREITEPAIARAVECAHKSDLAIVVVGEDSFREHWKEKTCGENRDRMDIELWGEQNRLVQQIAATGVDVVVILVNGRPLATKWIADNIPAIVEAWEPGSMGGQAIGEILFGEFNPSGKLPITIPAHVGQTPIFYNHKPTQYFRTYIDGGKEPLFPFGFGLSYTDFTYSTPKLSAQQIAKGDNVTVSVSVTNSGSMDGEEVVQMYIRDDVSVSTRPVKELKGFSRIALKKGESKIVEFTITPNELSYYNYKSEKVLEPGKFTVMVGGSSVDSALKKVSFVVK